ncbi:hypothetical protein [Tepidibacter mesophilus]|uniref:hypothetical protein n=1 Tax=Tepidibacter mesophilus TaxID=655607 RepID=UPI000C06EC1C|nr:hypothetical protein [Tepidibacter mesophilus]
MDMINIIGGYNKRINAIGSYYLISSISNNRNKFKEFTNIEFYNLLIEVLCFIFEKSLRRQYCIRDDIKYFIEKLNIISYKKLFSSEDLDELTNYIINGLTNNGKTFLFPYYSVEKNEHIDASIRIIEDKNVKINNQERLSYSLTTEGYRLLLSTKEYDELFQIQISQMVARLRIDKGDYTGAKQDIYEIVNTLEVQRQKIDNYIKIIKVDIFYIRENQYSNVIDTTVSILLNEMDKYEELKQDVLLIIRDKEEYLEGEEEISKEKIEDIRIQLIHMRDLIEGVTMAKNTAANLISRVQDFREEFSDILKKLLRTPVLKRFNFKEEILDKLEKDINFLYVIKELYVPLFKAEIPNTFNVSVPYQEQMLIEKEDTKEDTIHDKDDYDILVDEEKESKILYCENYYYTFIKALFEYGFEKENFTLREFLNHFLKINKDLYIELTMDSKLMRDVVMFFANQREAIYINKIMKLINNSTFSPNTDFQIERIVERLVNEEYNHMQRIDYLISEKILGDEMIINTEINLEDMTAVKLELTNINFKLIGL